MLQNIRPDYLLSYWVFAWYLLYILGLVRPNPKFAIIVALLENLLMLFLMVYFKVRPKKIIYFAIMIVLIKLIPLWTVRNHKIDLRDITATLGLVLMYIGWIVWDEKVNQLYGAYTQILSNSIQTPGMLLLDKIFRGLF
jgi:hypothetical protein